MSKPGEALVVVYRRNQERRASETAKRNRAIALYEKREAERIRNNQAALRAAFYDRHPDLAA